MSAARPLTWLGHPRLPPYNLPGFKLYAAKFLLWMRPRHMEFYLDVLRSLGLDGEPLTGERYEAFSKLSGLVVEELVPGQYMDFVIVKIRNEGKGVISFAKTWHAFMEGIKLEEGEHFLIYCTCPMVDRFVVLSRVGENIRLLYRRPSRAT